MDKSHFFELFERYLSDKMSKEEILEFQRLLTLEENEAMIRLRVNEELQQDIIPTLSHEPTWLDDMESKVLGELRESQTKIRFFQRRWLRITAAILGVISVGISMFLLSDLRLNERQAEVSPGGNKAVVRLANGKEINLSDQQSTLVLGEELKYADGSAIDGLGRQELAMQDVVIVVPRGGTYNVILSDGTKVWLNADSRLTYKARMEGQPRELMLEGEAYFEVMHQSVKRGDKMVQLPFIVHTSKHAVTVLGTAFNISAYQGEVTRTTLVEGKVAIRLPGSHDVQHLSPNQQAVIQDNRVFLHEVDASSFTTWKDGTFTFSDENLGAILAQVSRWYNVTVHYEEESLKNLKFEGVLPRYEQLHSLLKALETAGDVEFKINDGTVVVKRK